MDAARINEEYIVEDAIHSKRDSEYGESDIVFILNVNGKRHALHIEDKIDAIAMQNQSGRYNYRAEKDIAAGEYDLYSVLIVAPEKYLEANAEAFDGEWFKTGDYGRIDKDGFLFMVGRKKNLICLSNGKNVSPEELEEKLMKAIPYIKEVLVYEENNKIYAEFYLDEEDYPDAKERIKGDVNLFNQKMPIFKKINKVRTRDEEFPKTTTLKIVRKYSQK